MKRRKKRPINITNPYILAVLVMRISGYIFMLFYPFEGLILSLFFDCLDQYFFAWGNIGKEHYHKWDKPIDYLEYPIILYLCLDTQVFPVIIILFAYRTIGHVLYYFRKDDKIFILFPNILEYYFLVYLVITRFNFAININDWRIWLGLIIFKLIQEVYVHIFPNDTAYKVVPLIKKQLRK